MSAATCRPGSATVEGVELAGWVELRDETTRAGRRHVVAVNHRDGRATLLDQDDLCALADADVDAVAPARHELVEHLRANGFLADSPAVVEPDAPGGFLRTLSCSWTGADRVVRRLHAAGLRHLFGRVGVALQLVLAVAGGLAVVRTLANADGVAWVAEPWMLPALLAVDLAAIAVHELGHALVVVHNGRTVRAAGFALHLAAPALFVETTDGLLLDRRTRVVQALAGPWAEYLFTAAIALVAGGAGSAAVQLVVVRFVAVNLVGIAANLLPFVGLDGSWVLSDLTGQPDLRRRARRAVGALRAGSAAPSDLAWAAWGAANGLVATALVGLAGLFWYQRFASTLVAALTFHPVTAVVAIAILAFLARPALPGLRRTLAPLAQGLDRVRFRTERRWRVAAAEALAADPALAGLDDRALGAVAGLVRPAASTEEIDGPTATVDGRRYVLAGTDLARIRALAVPGSAGRGAPLALA